MRIEFAGQRGVWALALAAALPLTLARAQAPVEEVTTATPEAASTDVAPAADVPVISLPEPATAVAVDAPAVAAGGLLVDNYRAAVDYDAAYQGAVAEYRGGIASSRAALTAYLPEVRLSASQLENETSTRSTVAVSQPLFSMDRVSSLREARPRRELAKATLQTRANDLAQRLLKATSELIKANEELQQNRAKIGTLEIEAQKSAEEFRRGLGTVTDVRDTEVKLAQARAADLGIAAKVEAAARNIEQYTGVPQDTAQYRLAKAPIRLVLPSLEEMRARARGSNQQIVASERQLKLAEIARARARGAYLPTVAFTVSESHSAVGDSSNSGVTVSFPLQAPSILGSATASAGAERARAGLTQVTRQTDQDLARYYEAARVGAQEADILLSAISAAQLSVEANLKSFRGGVRSRVDVLNSIQTLYDVNVQYVTSMLTLGDNYFALLLQAGYEPDFALHKVEELFF